jgi:hypothetical protein
MEMLFVRTALVAAFCCSGAVLAQEVASFTELSACRVDEGHVLVRATFDGGACQAVGPAQLAEPRGTIVAVHFPTSSTSEMCTMQIVPVDIIQIIEASVVIADLAVSVSDPQNNVLAEGQVEVDENAPDCVAPRG